MSKTFFIDTSRCTACRGCQIACKEWNELPANATRQMGSHQNPPDLNPNNYKVVRFSEHLDGDVVRWNFFPDQCRHCIEPPCEYVASNLVQGAVIKDAATGAVIYTDKLRQLTAEGFKEMREACPYDIPRRNEGTGAIVKCTMCHERVTRGLFPICVSVCPTGAMNFGDRPRMLDLARQRLAAAVKNHPRAMLADADSVNVIYLLTDAPENYHPFSVAHRPSDVSRKRFLARMSAPLRITVAAFLDS